MAKGVQLYDHSGKVCCRRDELGSASLGVCVDTHVLGSEAERHPTEAIRRNSIQELVRSYAGPQSLSRNWRWACLPRLLLTPVCAAGASVLALWGLGSNLNRGASSKEGASQE
jgi:hypothetical protein